MKVTGIFLSPKHPPPALSGSFFLPKLDCRVRIITDDFLFAVPDRDFNEKIKEGIELAKRCLDNPPFEDLIYQGDIEIVKDSVTFKARKR